LKRRNRKETIQNVTKEKGGHILKPDAIDGPLLKELMASGTAVLYNHKSEVDALNVFPVPDGDTGTNMYLTFQAAFRELSNNKSLQVVDLLEAAAYGALMGARGNSGVIVSQFFRGFVKAIPKGTLVLTKKELAQGINGAANLAFKAVRHPVEGTILTVIKSMADYAGEKANDSSGLPEYAVNIYHHAVEILAKTPDMLPVLKQAGVVDAGGQGLVYFVKGIADCLNGVVVDTDTTRAAVAPAPVNVVTLNSFTDNELLPEEEINFQYCTEFILKGKKLDLEYIKNSLSPHGDCLLVVGEAETAKIHIHTNNPGIILDFAVRLGDMYEIQINNMVEQSQQRLAKKVLEGSPLNKLGIVAVAAGDGMERIFKSLGVQCVVNGGQTMNPSVEDLAKAVSNVNASNVIILPNNSNIIMTANHVQDLVQKPVRVIPTNTIPEGLAALICFDPEAGLDENVTAMSEKSTQVVTGEITYAVRGCKLGDLDIRQGDIIGLIDGEIATFGDTPERVVEETLRKIPAIHGGLVSLYYGSDISAAAAQELLTRLETQFSDTEFELYYGGQPLYYYLFSVE
jgi:DAK2 domain fusion protein YloV